MSQQFCSLPQQLDRVSWRTADPEKRYCVATFFEHCFRCSNTPTNPLLCPSYRTLILQGIQRVWMVRKQWLLIQVFWNINSVVWQNCLGFKLPGWVQGRWMDKRKGKISIVLIIRTWKLDHITCSWTWIILLFPWGGTNPEFFSYTHCPSITRRNSKIQSVLPLNHEYTSGRNTTV